MMTTLAKIGFSQSYTYFTWKNTKWELLEFLHQLLDWARYYRPNFFANTPDILHEYLQDGGRPAFEPRLVLAATLSPSYGIYSGYEHSRTSVREGSEEYLDSEKYEAEAARARRAAAPARAAAERDSPRRAGAAALREPALLDTHGEHVFAYSKAPDIAVAGQPRSVRAAREDVVVVPPDARAPGGVPRPRPAHRRALPLADRRNYVGLAPGRACDEDAVLRERPRAARAARPLVRVQPDLVQDGRLLRDPHARVLRRQRRRLRRLPRAQQKLDYLQWLGIDCIWLLPLYPSPLRDGGYDIADFYGIHPDYGTVEDFRAFVEAAHERGMRVIADLVMNHTSSDHPWFQESREDRDGPYGDCYVWSDTDEPYRTRGSSSSTRSVELDVRPRARPVLLAPLLHHQPDLNYENPAVQDAMIEVLRFWLDLGLDGFRLDAVPYLFEEEGRTARTCRETHEYLKRVRAEVDANYPDRVLLAEANQWPDDVVDYFGDGDECHMAFHFPVMPRMFMALRREEALPMIEILDRTPPIPASGQWGLFLRNHDELTLEMVTDEERDYMYAEYAKDPRMKLNLGIRRRLAPLLDSGRDEIELMHAILFSLPGSPVLYYGDEIAMGDNVYLGDRDGVRTPMQWTGDRNGGFSRADFAQLYLPPLMDPVYGFQAVNVEAQLRLPTSLLRWLRRFIELRKQHPVFGVGDYRRAAAREHRRSSRTSARSRRTSSSASTISRGRRRRSSSTSLFAGQVPVEMFGKTRVPADRRAPVPAHARAARLLLVPALKDPADDE